MPAASCCPRALHLYDAQVVLCKLYMWHSGLKLIRSDAVHAFGHSVHAASSDSPESLVNQFYELAQKGNKPDSSLVSSLNSSLEKKGSSFGPQEIANLLWSVAKTGTKLDPKILASLVGLVSAKAGSFKPAQIAAVLWALGSLGQKVDSGNLPVWTVCESPTSRCSMVSKCQPCTLLLLLGLKSSVRHVQGYWCFVVTQAGNNVSCASCSDHTKVALHITAHLKPI